jgi:hypothetical protein
MVAKLLFIAEFKKQDFQEMNLYLCVRTHKYFASDEISHIFA